MYCLDDVRTRKIQAFVVALQFLAASSERAATIIFLAQPVSLDHGTHGSVQYQYPVCRYRNHLISD